MDHASAFDNLVRIHQRPLVRFATRLLTNPDVAEDIVQEAFFRIWRAKPTFVSSDSVRVYLFRAVHNLCRDHLSGVRHNDIPIERASDLAAPRSTQPEIRCEQQILADAVAAAVRTLPEAQRAVFVLSHYEGFRYDEIAMILQCPAGTVASRKHLAVETLRRRLRPWISREDSK